MPIGATSRMVSLRDCKVCRRSLDGGIKCDPVVDVVKGAGMAGVYRW